MERGKFIVLEGISGSGKGVQRKLITDYLMEQNLYANVLQTREPTNSEYGTQARILRGQHRLAGENPENYAREYLNLFLQDRVDHLNRVIRPNLEQGIHIVCDRYMFSTIVLQQSNTLSAAEIVSLHKQAEVLVPDLTFIFDLPASEALKRIEERGVERGLSETLERLERARQGYLHLSLLYPNYNLVVIDSLANPEKVFQRYRTYVDRLFNK